MNIAACKRCTIAHINLTVFVHYLLKQKKTTLWLRWIRSPYLTLTVSNPDRLQLFLYCHHHRK